MNSHMNFNKQDLQNIQSCVSDQYLTCLTLGMRYNKDLCVFLFFSFYVVFYQSSFVNDYISTLVLEFKKVFRSYLTIYKLNNKENCKGSHFLDE